MLRKAIALASVVLLGLTACSDSTPGPVASPVATPTSLSVSVSHLLTPTPTAKPAQVVTATPRPTSTPRPTATPTTEPEVPQQAQIMTDYESDVYTPAWPQYAQCLTAVGGQEGQDQALLTLPGLIPESGYYVDDDGVVHLTGGTVKYKLAEWASSTTQRIARLSTRAYEAEEQFKEDLRALEAILESQGFDVSFNPLYSTLQSTLYNIAFLGEFTEAEWKEVAPALTVALRQEGVTIHALLAYSRALHPRCDQ